MVPSRTRLVNEVLSLTGRPDRATDRTRKSIELAVLAASELNSPVIDSRHLLCGLVREGEGVACHILKRLGLKEERLKQMVAELPGSSDVSLPRIDEDMSAAIHECWTLATSLNHNYIGTEHLLLAIVRSRARAYELLRLLGMDSDVIDAEIRKLLGVPT